MKERHEGVMTDIERLLLETIKPSLKDLSKKGVGIYDSEESDGIHYILDGKSYLISVNEE